MTRPIGRRCSILFLALLPLAACERRPEPEDGGRGAVVDTTGADTVPTVQPARPTSFLLCPGDTAGARDARQSIGPNGGTLTVGRHELQIPRGALQSNREFRFALVPGDTVGITIEPSVRFASGRRATLTIDASHCADLDAGRWQIWRMYPGQPHRVPTTVDGKRFTAPVDSTSGYIIAS